MKCELKGSVDFEVLLNLQQCLTVAGRVKGRVAANIHSSILKSDKFLVKLLAEGYCIPFVKAVNSYFLKNNNSARRFSTFVESEVVSLLDKGVIVPVPVSSFINPLSVADQGAKLRLILDCSHLNEFIAKYRFKLDGMPTVLRMFSPGCFMVKLDLKSGYHHVDIHPNHQKFISFSWNAQCYSFSVLPFGLSSAPYAFTKILRPFVSRWRSLGFKVVMYLDDLIALGETFNDITALRAILLHDLTEAGFVVNTEKSVFEPSKQIDFLGFTLDSDTFSISVPPAKIEKIEQTLAYYLSKSPFITARQILKCSGLIISVKLVVGNLALIKTRNCYRFVGSCPDWDSARLAPENVWSELRFWHENLQKYIHRHLSKTSKVPIKIQVYSDASSTGGGAFVCLQGETMKSHLEWDQSQARKSSTWRELFVVLHALESFGLQLSNQHLVWNCDNQAVPLIIRRGSMNAELHEIAIKIFDFCHRHKVTLSAHWIPREENKLADNLSRVRDWDDWAITPAFFQNLMSWLKIHVTVDLFANAVNKKVSRFYSKFWCPGTSGVDAFGQSWAAEFAYACPPPYLVTETLQKFLSDGNHLVLIAPFWPSSCFWPILSSREIQKLSTVILQVPHSNRFLLPGTQKHCCFLCPEFDFSLLVILLCRTCEPYCNLVLDIRAPPTLVNVKYGKKYKHKLCVEAS